MARKRVRRLMARPARISARRLAMETLARDVLGLVVLAVVYTKMLGLW